MLSKVSQLGVLILAVSASAGVACSTTSAAEDEPASTEMGQVKEEPDENGPGETPQCEPGHDDAPGRGRTADFEVAYLRFIIDHHFGALRMSELAAGTDLERDARIAENEGTSQTPEFEPVEAKAVLPDLRSIARRNNRDQREEILKAQDMLRKWYGVEHEPQLTEDARQMIAELEALPRGADFDMRFIEMFSRHHFSAVPASAACQASRELEHQMLETFCRNIVVVQISDIQDMRHLACDEYKVCDVVPVELSEVMLERPQM